MVPKKELERRMERFKSVCRDRGIKLTHQRVEIFREVAQTADHPGAEQVYERVRTRIPTVSLDTVYRTIWLLKDLGLVVTLGRAHGYTRFDANLHDHHHFVCNHCGFTRDICSDELGTLSFPADLDNLGRAEIAHVELRGVCHECMQEGI